ncbi:MAG: Teichoic acids export ATP-binding protein TagH [Betaproteobacteria bacterium ADurb.Bin341]|nr:MAG: Teichoic acids export ATP-binding protein TagH [Betaproteobacteria bacterium ADurb.Bin341]
MSSQDDIAISVRNLTKTYRLFRSPTDRIKQALTLGRGKFHDQFTALRDVSFDIKKGETVGIIGKNGSGKSTLLQLICGILKPTYGSVQVNGRISALLELGAGFNPEFTGRENVYFQGTLMGFSRAEMDARFDDISAFADIGEFIDQPVGIYSSGMFVRLAFASAINFNPDILVIDEALAVGDSSFQAKCMVHLKSIQKKGCSAILLVSHDLVAIQNLCTRVLTLEDNHLVCDAVPEQSISRYQTELSLSATAAFPVGHPLRQGPQRFATLQHMSVMNVYLEAATQFAMGDRIVIELSFVCHEKLPAGRFGVTFSNTSGVLLHDFASGFSGVIGFAAGCHTFRITTGPILAYPGRYFLGAWIQHSKGVPSDDRFGSVLAIHVYDGGKVGHREANFSGIRCSNTEVYLPCSFEKI